MLIERVAELAPKERFIYWIRERESIRLKKASDVPKPWTDDEVLQRYRFCNVRRMDDAVSQWLLKNWYEPYFDHPNMLMACALARHFNKPGTLDAIGFPKRWCPDRIKRVARSLDTPFNSAYIISGGSGGKRGSTYGDKIGLVVDCVLEGIRKVVVNSSSLEETSARLVEHRGWGWFMAGQATSDLRWAMRGSWGDRFAWAPMGPGSKRGMSRLFERSVSRSGFNELLTSVITLVRDKLPKIAKRLEAIDVQNCLCEFDKYDRTLWNEGKPKRLYRVS